MVKILLGHMELDFLISVSAHLIQGQIQEGNFFSEEFRKEPLWIHLDSDLEQELYSISTGTNLGSQFTTQVTRLTPDQHTGGPIDNCQKDHFTSLNNVWEDFHPTLKWCVVDADPLDDKHLAVWVIVGYLCVTHIPFVISGTGVADGSHRIHILCHGAGID